jgi:hypothetical protein
MPITLKITCTESPHCATFLFYSFQFNEHKYDPQHFDKNMLSYSSCLALRWTCPWYVTKQQAFQACGGVNVQLKLFLTSEVNTDDWLASLPDRFGPEETTTVPII